MLQQSVFAGDAQISTAVLDIRRHIGGTHHQHPHIGLVGGENEFAGLFRVFQHLNASCLEQRQGVVKDAAFGKREGNHFTLSMSAPMPRSLASI